MWVNEHAWLYPLIMAAAFVVTLLFGKRLPKGGAEVGVAAIFACLALSVVGLVGWQGRSSEEVKVGQYEAVARGAGQVPALSHATPERSIQEETEAVKVRPYYEKEVTWLQVGANKIGVGIHIDGFAVVMVFVVALISAMVHLFSTEYVRGDRRFTHFFLSLNLFTVGMFILVLASSTLEMILGWEIMGLCSFLLIGHWWEDKPNSDAALKAFFTTRTGDIGLLVGVSILFWAAGQTFNVARINQLALAGGMRRGFLVAGAIALFISVIGKSAQFPLHTWLPDAMAGPTPASALIHAATMVVAGVYLVARLYGVFFSAFNITVEGVNPIAVIGGLTVIIGAALAFVQHDIKKVLAYSTVSQLGYMVMALGVGAWTAGIFHLFTHAFFKALLFLGAGSISHAVHHSFDMKKDMGGLRKFMPTTFATFMIGTGALMGIIPLAGFWSKDEIITGAGANGYMTFQVVGLIGAVMTAAYMTRCVYLTFFGEYRGHGHPHESPWQLTVPLVVLAVFSIGAGLINAPRLLAFTHFTAVEAVTVAGVPEHGFEIVTAILSTLAVAIGIGIVYAFYWLHAPAPLHGLTERSKVARGGYVFLEEKYGLDTIYNDAIVGSIKGPIAEGSYWVNQHVIDGVVNGVGEGAVQVAQLTYDIIDQDIVDGAVNGSAQGAGLFGRGLRLVASGKVQQYAAFLFAGAGIGAIALAIANR